MGRDRFETLLRRTTSGVTVNHDSLTRFTSEELIERQFRYLRLDVPQSDINRAEGRHLDRSATPIRMVVEQMPDVFDAMRSQSDEEGGEVANRLGDRKLTAIQRPVTDPVDAFVSDDFDDHVVPTWARDDRTNLFNLHRFLHEECLLVERHRASGQRREASEICRALRLEDYFWLDFSTPNALRARLRASL